MEQYSDHLSTNAHRTHLSVEEPVLARSGAGNPTNNSTIAVVHTYL